MKKKIQTKNKKQIIIEEEGTSSITPDKFIIKPNKKETKKVVLKGNMKTKKNKKIVIESESKSSENI